MNDLAARPLASSLPFALASSIHASERRVKAVSCHSKPVASLLRPSTAGPLAVGGAVTAGRGGSLGVDWGQGSPRTQLQVHQGAAFSSGPEGHDHSGGVGGFGSMVGDSRVAQPHQPVAPRLDKALLPARPATSLPMGRRPTQRSNPRRVSIVDPQQLAQHRNAPEPSRHPRSPVGSGSGPGPAAATVTDSSSYCESSSLQLEEGGPPSTPSFDAAVVDPTPASATRRGHTAGSGGRTRRSDHPPRRASLSAGMHRQQGLNAGGRGTGGAGVPSGFAFPLSGSSVPTSGVPSTSSGGDPVGGASQLTVPSAVDTLASGHSGLLAPALGATGVRDGGAPSSRPATARPAGSPRKGARMASTLRSIDAALTPGEPTPASPWAGLGVWQKQSQLLKATLQSHRPVTMTSLLDSVNDSLLTADTQAKEEATKAYLESLGHVALGSHRVVQAARRDFRRLKATTDAALADALHRREYDTSRACMSKSQAYDSHAAECDRDVALRVMRLHAERDALQRVNASLAAYDTVIRTLASTRSFLGHMDRVLLRLVRRAIVNDVALTPVVFQVMLGELQEAATAAAMDAEGEDRKLALLSWHHALGEPLETLRACAEELDPGRGPPGAVVGPRQP